MSEEKKVSLQGLLQKISDALDKTDVDDKLEAAIYNLYDKIEASGFKEKATEKVTEAYDKAVDKINDLELDEKAKDAFDKLKVKAGDTFEKGSAAAKESFEKGVDVVKDSIEKGTKQFKADQAAVKDAADEAFDQAVAEADARVQVVQDNVV